MRFQSSAPSPGKPTIGTFDTFFADPGNLKSFGLPQFRWLQALMRGSSVCVYIACRKLTRPLQAVKQSLLEQGMSAKLTLIPKGIPLPAGAVALIKSGAARR